MNSETRRIYDRYQAKDDTFALLKPNCDRLGQLRDISMGGCAFEYMRFEAFSFDDPIDESIRLDLIMGDDDLYVSQLPCKIVYDRQMTDQIDGARIDGVEMRRCGLEFGHLSDEQLAAIRTFIQKHGTEGSETGGSA